jgi:hypothetical protein
MGLIINKGIKTFLGDSLTSFYARIENITLDRRFEIITIVVACYSTWDDAKMSFPIYDDLVNPGFSGLIGARVTYNDEDVDIPVMIQEKIDGDNKPLDLYKFGYELVKKEYGKIFGNENITIDK